VLERYRTARLADVGQKTQDDDEEVAGPIAIAVDVSDRRGRLPTIIRSMIFFQTQHPPA